MRRLHPLVRLAARLLFGFSVLAFFGYVSIEMASHHFQGVAERTVRQAFSEDTKASARARYDAVCGIPELDRTPLPECDPIAVKAKRSLRSTFCGHRGLLRFLGRRWRCVAEFADGTALSVDVTLGFRRHHLVLALPFRESDAANRD